jgi:hypothetical protein
MIEGSTLTLTAFTPFRWGGDRSVQLLRGGYIPSLFVINRKTC